MRYNIKLVGKGTEFCFCIPRAMCKKYLYNKKRKMFTETLDKARSKEAVIDEGKQVIADIKDVFKA